MAQTHTTWEEPAGVLAALPTPSVADEAHTGWRSYREIVNTITTANALAAIVTRVAEEVQTQLRNSKKQFEAWGDLPPPAGAEEHLFAGIAEEEN
jgi:hypothetical protein